MSDNSKGRTPRAAPAKKRTDSVVGPERQPPPMAAREFPRPPSPMAANESFRSTHQTNESFQLTQKSAERLRAIERGRLMMNLDLRAAGGTLSTQEVAEHLEISPQAVDKQRQGGKLLAVTDPQGHFRFPAFQFTRPRVRQHLREVLRRLDESSPFVKLNWLLNLDARLGAAPVDLLDRGEVEPVLRAADAFGRHLAG